MTKLEKSIESTKKAIEKAEKSKERYEKLIKNNWDKWYKLGMTDKDAEDLETFIDGKRIKSYEELTANQYTAIANIHIYGDDKENKEKEIIRLYKKLEELELQQTAVEMKEKEIEDNKCIVIEEYLDSWLEKAIAYWEQKGWQEEIDGRLFLISKEDLKRERERKSVYITSKVYKKVGKIVDATGLYIANDGNINGKVIGENGSTYVKTIIAGGYYIQRLHFRVLLQ